MSHVPLFNRPELSVIIMVDEKLSCQQPNPVPTLEMLTTVRGLFAVCGQIHGCCGQQHSNSDTLFIRKICEYQIAQDLFYQPSGKPNVIFLINKSRFQKNQTPKLLS